MQKLYRETAAIHIIIYGATTCNRVYNCGITSVCDVTADSLSAIEYAYAV